MAMRLNFSASAASSRVKVSGLPAGLSLCQLLSGVSLAGEVIALARLPKALTSVFRTEEFMIEFTTSECARSFVAFANEGPLRYETEFGTWNHVSVALIETNTHPVSSITAALLERGATRCVLLKGFKSTCVWACMAAITDLKRIVDVLYVATDHQTGDLYMEFDALFLANQAYHMAILKNLPCYAPTQDQVSFVSELPNRPTGTELYISRKVSHIPANHLTKRYFAAPYNFYHPLPVTGPESLREDPDVPPAEDVEREDPDHTPEHQDGWSVTQKDAFKLAREEALQDPSFRAHFDFFYEGSGELNPAQVEEYAAVARHRREMAWQQDMPEGHNPDCSNCSCGCVPLPKQPTPQVVLDFFTFGTMTDDYPTADNTAALSSKPPDDPPGFI